LDWATNNHRAIKATVLLVYHEMDALTFHPLSVVALIEIFLLLRSGLNVTVFHFLAEWLLLLETSHSRQLKKIREEGALFQMLTSAKLQRVLQYLFSFSASNLLLLMHQKLSVD